MSLTKTMSETVEREDQRVAMKTQQKNKFVLK
jgi:hypothetical protein